MRRTKKRKEEQNVFCFLKFLCSLAFRFPEVRLKKVTKNDRRGGGWKRVGQVLNKVF